MADEQEVQEKQEQPLNPDLMGYPNVEALVAAKRASDAEAQRIMAERDALKTQLHNFYQPEANPRQEVKRRDRPEDRLTEFGVPVDALQEMFDQRLQVALQPIVAAAGARNKIVGTYPDYVKFESDVNQFLQSNPELNDRVGRMAQSDPEGALEYAFLKFGEDRRGTIAQKAGDQQAMTDAGIPSSRNGEGRRGEVNLNSDISKAWQKYQQTGSPADAREYARARLKTVISEDFLRQ